MKGKKSFTAYCDWVDTFDELSDEEAGRLAKHLFAYVNDKEPQAPDRITKLLFAPMKATLKRDLNKWLTRVERNRENGGKGGRPKKSEPNPKKPTGFNGNPSKAKKGDSDSVRDSDSDSVSDSVRCIKFSEQVRSLPTKLPDNEVQKFIDYWTEKNPQGKKMKFEKQRTFDPKKRLATWEVNYQDWKKEKSSGQKESQMEKLRQIR